VIGLVFVGVCITFSDRSSECLLAVCITFSDRSSDCLLRVCITFSDRSSDCLWGYALHSVIGLVVVCWDMHYIQ